MGYTKPYIPRADALFRTWAEAFCLNLNRAPAAYMMSPAETQYLMQCLDRFVAALGMATDERTRTKGTIIAKDDARSILKKLLAESMLDQAALKELLAKNGRACRQA